MEFLTIEFIMVMFAALRGATPILAVVLGETLTQRSGIINLGVEGQMLFGAMIGFAVTFNTGSPWLGVLTACIAGLILSSLHALLVLYFKANQIASGVAVLILGSGLSAFYGIPYVGKKINSLGNLADTWVAQLPIIGNSLSAITPTTLLILLLIPIASLFLFKTQIGLIWRSVGESSSTTRNLGVNPIKYQLAAILVGGALSGLAGAALSIDYTSSWVEGMTSGRGLVAVGLVIVARWNPWLSLPAAMLFGISETLNLKLQSWGIDISPYLLGTLPYLLPLLVLILSYRKLKSSGGGMPQGLSAVFKNS